MNNIEEKIEAAWQRSRGEKEYDPGYPVKASSNFADGYKAGAAEALSHQWVSVEDAKPPYGERVFVMSIVNNGIAWFDENSNGIGEWYAMDDNINLDFIQFWMPIPPLPEARKEGM